jgi:anti-sigma factor RsiW
MVIGCQKVLREISSYIDDDVEPGLRADMEEHLRGCKHCTAVLDGIRNVIRLCAGDRVFELPVGFSRRLRSKLENITAGSRRKRWS